MVQQLEELVAQYERGHLARREFLGALVALTYGATGAPAAKRERAVLRA